jgi:hypothetical protein
MFTRLLCPLDDAFQKSNMVGSTDKHTVGISNGCFTENARAWLMLFERFRKREKNRGLESKKRSF